MQFSSLITLALVGMVSMVAARPVICAEVCLLPLRYSDSSLLTIDTENPRRHPPRPTARKCLLLLRLLCRGRKCLRRLNMATAREWKIQVKDVSIYTLWCRKHRRRIIDSEALQSQQHMFGPRSFLREYSTWKGGNGRITDNTDNTDMTI